MQSNAAADDKLPHEKKAARLQEVHGKDITAYCTEGTPDAARKGTHQGRKKQEKRKLRKTRKMKRVSWSSAVSSL